jgi:hypothetical protein
MAEFDTELKTAIAAYLHDANKVADVPLPELTEEDFDRLVEMTARGQMAKMFQVLHAQLGRYPTFEDLRHGSHAR